MRAQQREGEGLPSWAVIFGGSEAMGVIFRLLVLVLGALLTYGAWQSLRLPAFGLEIGFIHYWLITVGLLMILSSASPMRKGVGLLMALLGFEGLYFVLEQSLLLTALLSVMDLVITVAIVYLCDAWAEPVGEEVRSS
jgi:hypothetical protein